jgi:hypothetical protein
MKIPAGKNIFIFILAISIFSIASVYAVDSLPGSDAPEGFPNGCIDCHSVSDNNDFSLKATLDKLEDHPSITKMVNNVPNDCSMCHTESYAGELKGIIHNIHLENDDEDGFVKNYGQNCLACHSDYPKSGDPLIKSAEKNWS